MTEPVFEPKADKDVYEIYTHRKTSVFFFSSEAFALFVFVWVQKKHTEGMEVEAFCGFASWDLKGLGSLGVGAVSCSRGDWGDSEPRPENIQAAYRPQRSHQLGLANVRKEKQNVGFTNGF